MINFANLPANAMGSNPSGSLAPAPAKTVATAASKVTLKASPVVNQTVQTTASPVVKTLPSSAVGTDWSAGFNDYMTELGNESNQLGAIDAATASSYGSYDANGNFVSANPTEEALHEQNLSDIQKNAASETTDVNAAAKTAELQQSRAGELLGLGPAAIKYNIDQFSDQSDQLFKSIASARSQIDEDLNTATLNEDSNYVNQLNTEKMNLLQAQTKAITDKSTFMTTAFNAMLGMKQANSMDTNDAMSRVQNLYNLNQTPSQADWNAAGFAGTPPKPLPLNVWSAPTVTGGKMTQTNTQTGEVRVLSMSEYSILDPLSQAQRVQNDVQAYQNGTITSLSQIADPDERAAAEALSNAPAVTPTSTAPSGGFDIMNFLGTIKNDVTSLFGGTPTTAATSTGGVSTDNAGSQAMATSLQSLNNTN